VVKLGGDQSSRHSGRDNKTILRLRVVVLISCPTGRVAEDVLADRLQFLVVSDYMFVVIALPDRCAWGIPYLVDVFGGGGFESAHDRWDGIGNRFAESFRRGTACRAPTVGDDDNTVHMIRHDRACLYLDILPQFCRFQPFLMDNDAIFIQSHFSINNLAEKALPFPSAYRQEICARLGIIMSLQPYRSPMMSI